MIKKIVVLSCMFSACVAHASIDDVLVLEKLCLDKAVSNNDMKQCEFEAYEAADRELNLVYKAIKSKLEVSSDSTDKEILNRLVRSERAWVGFKEANCDLMGIDMLGGSGESLIVTGCLVNATADRIRELQRLFK